MNYNTLLNVFNEAITKDKKTTIAYANADTLNKIYTDRSLKEIYNSFDHIHPDGIGIYYASKYLYGPNGMSERFTGSDFYLELITEAVNQNWSFFFFGHTENELKKIKNNYPKLKISGTSEGYDFSNNEVVTNINNADPDIIIIGLSCPIQEKWIYENKNKVRFKVILAVGDGIRVFSGDKIRGPKIIQKTGFEWIVRIITNPWVNLKRYSKGIPLFLKRIISFKQTLI